MSRAARHLLEVDLDQLLKDETLMPPAGGQTPDERTRS